MTDISMEEETVIAMQGMGEMTVMVAMMGGEEIPHQGVVTTETAIMMGGIRRAVKEGSLKGTIEVVVMTIAEVIIGITEMLGVDAVSEGHQAEVASNMRGWSSKAHPLPFLPLLHPKKKQQRINRPLQSAWKKRGWSE